MAKKLFFTWTSPLLLLHKQEKVLKNCSVSKPLYYAKLISFEKRQVLKR